MLEKGFVERFLKLNHVAPNASADEIRAVLTEARWAPEEVEAAVILVQGADEVARAALLERHKEKTFRPDMDWSSQKLSSLLGIDVVVDPKAFKTNTTLHIQAADMGRRLLVGLGATLAALVVALCLGVLLMYVLEVGPFREPVDAIL